MVRLTYVLESWRTIRNDTASAVDEFPGDLDYRPLPELMTFGELARHCLDAGLGLTGILLSGLDDMTQPDFREKMKKYYSSLPSTATAAELAGELRNSVDGSIEKLAQQSEAFYNQIITRFDGQKVTRLEMLQMVKEHELTHRSQMFVYLRLNGVVPATTRRRMAKK